MKLACFSNKKILFYLGFIIFLTSAYICTASKVANLEDFRLFPPFQPAYNTIDLFHWGGEYKNIAISIVQGRGFSNPFHYPTGPTSWCLPIYPYVLAGIIKFAWSPTIAFYTLIFIKNLVLIFSGLLLYELVRFHSKRIAPSMAVVLYLVWLYVFSFHFFQFTHDMWLVLLGLNILIIGSFYLIQNQLTLLNALGWGFFGGLAFLTSPSLGLAWLTATGWIFLSKRNFSWVIKAVLVASFILFCWGLRGYLAMGRFIPTKSNFYFQLEYANYEIPQKDGLFTQHSYHIHPYMNNRRAKEVAEMGELKFLDEYKTRFIENFKKDPWRYFRNVKNRFVAIFIKYHVFHLRLNNNTVVVYRFFHALPFLSILGLAVFFRKRFTREMFFLAITYFVFLTPYVLICYRLRYSIPLVVIQVFFIFMFIDAICDKLLGLKTKTPGKL